MHSIRRMAVLLAASLVLTGAALAESAAQRLESVADAADDLDAEREMDPEEREDLALPGNDGILLGTGRSTGGPVREARGIAGADRHG